jgi:hypothetical protein
MDPNVFLYGAQFLAAIAFALVCEYLLKRRFEEAGYTWALATVGIAQVGLIVAARLALAPVPPLTGADAAWWTWWTVFWSFLASALPIWGWQLWLMHARTKDLLGFTSRRNRTDDGE